MGEHEKTFNKIVEWLNEASTSTDQKLKVANISKVQELLIHQNPQLLESFLDDVLAFQSDRTMEVRRSVVGFIEESCKKDPAILPRVMDSLDLLLRDSVPQVQKRVVQAASQIYRGTLMYIARTQPVPAQMEKAWGAMCTMKSEIVKLIDSDNDGIRTQSVKFLEGVVLLQTYPEAESMVRENDFNLEDIPLTLKIVRRRRLEEEASMIFQLLVKFHGEAHVSSVNLMTCMGSLTLIARMRPQFMGKVITCLENLNKKLPPTLSKSQVNSVRKHLKLQLTNLLKQPSAVDYHPEIMKLLADLGCTPQEIAKIMPKVDDKSRRNHKRPGTESASSLHKRPKLEALYRPEPVTEQKKSHSSKAIPDVPPELTEKFIAERLAPETVSELVLAALHQVPASMPPHFPTSYTPFKEPGSQAHIQYLAKLLHSQMSGSAGRQVPRKSGRVLTELEEDDLDEVAAPPPPKAAAPVAPVAAALEPVLLPPPPPVEELMDQDGDDLEGPLLPQRESNEQLMSEREKLKELTPMTPMTRPLKQKARALKLAEITRPLSQEMKTKMCLSAVKRILNAEKTAQFGGVNAIRSKIIVTLASTYNSDVRGDILQFVVDDLQNKLDLDLAISWLYEEYSLMQSFTRKPVFNEDDGSAVKRYVKLFCTLAVHLAEKPEREPLLKRLYLEAPCITEEATDILKSLSCDETRCSVGLQLLQSLVIRRPPKQLTYLNALLEHSAHDSTEVRSNGMKCVLALYDDRSDLRSIIEEYAIMYLGFLQLPAPPDVLFGAERGRPSKADTWAEGPTKACLYLYLELLPHEHRLIHELTRVYAQTVADVKRIILRLLDAPVRGMGMDSPELLKLVEECPKGAETLVTRVIHILTDKTPPSAELVKRVRELYQSRVSDVRFLIPVLNGLTKREVIDSLPRLIKLNPIVVKEVFNRLLGNHSDSSSHNSPLTPVELLVALHVIDPKKCELKTVIKATTLCFSEKQAYTQENLAIVMQQLMEMNPLPTLLMRTVIQSLAAYPNLSGFVMNILQRLILKQVWTQRKVWEGFIKCCQRTKPQSFQVLLQLPAPQLQEVLDSCPEMRQPLLQHVQSFTDTQRSHVPQSVMDVLTGTRHVVQEDYDAQIAEPMSPDGLTIDVREDAFQENSGTSEPLPPGMD
ncbi:symplekin [Frankliniella occidentalis]|uniref:Symplekin n=1 Tax=Frankliniella occidentalis TaxID=133901 RepID=A0A6J1TL22_FRAOC|nr:symplekin [Frankliniella occidentalis]